MLSNTNGRYLHFAILVSVLFLFTCSLIRLACDEGGPTRSSIFLKAVYRRARAWYEMEDYLKALNDVSCCHELEPNDQMFTDMYKEVIAFPQTRPEHPLEIVSRNCV